MFVECVTHANSVQNALWDKKAAGCNVGSAGELYGCPKQYDATETCVVYARATAAS